MRKLVIGDIHGGLKSLIQCLNRCEYNRVNDELIFLGDYVDGWSQSAELIQFLIELSENSTHKIIFIRGNHDKWCSEWLNTGIANKIWINQGGKATMESYIKTGYNTSDKHRKFFRELHNYYIDENNNAFIHGGFISRKGVGHEPYSSNYYWDRDLWNIALMSHERESEVTTLSGLRFRKHKEIFIGHTSTLNYKCKKHLPEYNISEQENKNGQIVIPMNRCNVWNIDTGGGYLGKLTIMDIKTKEFWQSDRVNEIYKNEKGR